MKSNTIKDEIKRYLAHGEWMYKGPIINDVGYVSKHSSDNIARALREGYSGRTRSGGVCEKYLDRRLVPNPAGKGQEVTQYRLSLEGLVEVKKASVMSLKEILNPKKLQPSLRF